ncbi:MAG: hypothetical protein JWN68_2717 [Nocardioides sp.]|jgi:hypothetical protein|nr:hypothetical protein [Nocardioides sp.]
MTTDVFGLSAVRPSHHWSTLVTPHAFSQHPGLV